MKKPSQIKTPLVVEEVSNEQIFMSNLVKYRDMLLKEGLQVQISSPKALETFRAMPKDQQNLVVDAFHNYVDVCEDSIKNQMSLKNSRQLLWKMLKVLKWHPSSDALDKVQDDEIVEIYRIDNTQLFRNLRFLEICSYTIADLYVRPWTELYARPANVTDQIMSEITECIQKKRTVISKVEDYFLMELDSAFNQVFKVTQGTFSPLFDEEQNLAGFMCSLKGEVVGITSINSKTLDKTYVIGPHSELGPFLKRERIKNKLSVFDVQEVIKCDPKYIYQIEENKISPFGATLIQLCKLYNTDVNELLYLLTRENLSAVGT